MKELIPLLQFLILIGLTSEFVSASRHISTSAHQHISTSVNGRLGISQNKRYFTDGNDKPIFWLEYTQWTTYPQLSFPLCLA